MTKCNLYACKIADSSKVFLCICFDVKVLDNSEKQLSFINAAVDVIQGQHTAVVEQ